MKRVWKNLLKLSSFGAVALTVSACVGDATSQDEQREIVNEALGQFQPVVGKYSGSVSSAADGKSLGGLQITLVANTISQPSQDGTGTSQKAVLQGQITYSLVGSQAATATFSLGDYDPSTQIFRTTFNINDPSGTAHTIDVSGTINGNQFNGDIDADEYVNFGGNFSLEKNALPEAPPAALVGNYSQRAKQWLAVSSVYAGTVEVNGSSVPVKLTVTGNTTDPNQMLLNVLEPKHMVAVNVDIGGIFTMVFPAAATSLDDEQGSIAGSSSLATTSASYTENLSCSRIQANGFYCNFTGTRAAFSGNFYPVAQTSVQ